MPKRTKTTICLLLALALAGAGLFMTRQRQIIGVDQIGVVISPGQRIAVYQAGDHPLVLPLLQRLVVLTAKPIRYELTEAKAIAITPPEGPALRVACQIRYQIEDAAKLVASQGEKAPQAAIEALIQSQVTAHINTALAPAGSSLDDVPTRIALVGDTHQGLKEALAPFGVTLLAFELISW